MTLCNCTRCRCPDKGKHSDPQQWTIKQAGSVKIAECKTSKCFIGIVHELKKGSA